MKLIKNKRADEAMPFAEIIGWAILGVLILFVLVWYSGLGTKIISIIRSFF